LSKLVTEYDKELFLDLDKELFDGVYAPIFKLIQQHFSETQKLPTLETLEAVVTAKAPKTQLPVVAGVMAAIKNTNIKDISSKEIIKGLRDKHLLKTMDGQIKALAEAAMQKDTEEVRTLLNGVVEDVNISRAKPTNFAEAMEAEDTSKIITTGIDGVDEHLVGMAGLTIVSGASGCVDAQTEFMTPQGWKKISEYNEGDQVLQWNPDGSTNFVEPTNYINKPADIFYHLKNKTVDQMLSPEHNMVYRTRKSSTIQHKPMSEVWKDHNRLAAGFQGQFFNTYKAPSRRGVTYNDDELRLMIALSADGSIDPRGRLQVTFRLKKERKKERLVTLLEACAIKYRRNDTPHNGYTQISFRPPKLTKDLTELWEANEQQLRVIYDEFVHWDGAIDKRTGNKRFYTTIKEHADFIQYVINAVGDRRCSIRIDDRVGHEYVTAGQTYIRKSISYEVLEASTKVSSVTIDRRKQTAETITEITPEEGARKYCFTVPSGHFMIRRNNTVVVSANSGKSAFLLEAAIGQFKAGHSVLFISLELSAQVLGKRLKSSLTGIPFGKIVADDL
ncbi:MAG: hypothetical protein U9R05_10215, partial [Chloroflexota bacterium]|nr:hypothetical protein [Chloroflexota bacterium]